MREQVFQLQTVCGCSGDHRAQEIRPGWGVHGKPADSESSGRR